MGQAIERCKSGPTHLTLPTYPPLEVAQEKEELNIYKITFVPNSVT
jgi:hypothetical protein